MKILASNVILMTIGKRMYKERFVNVTLNTLRKTTLNAHSVKINLISVNNAETLHTVLSATLMEISTPFLIRRMITVFALEDGFLIMTMFVKIAKWLSKDA